MIVTTTEKIENEEIEKYLGIVCSFDESYWGFEGKMDSLIKDLCEEAVKLDADAVVGFRFVGPSTYTTDDDGDCAKPDLIAYGTAVKLKR